MMKICFLACEIYQPELEQVLAQIKQEKLYSCELELTYLPAKLHVDLKKLKTAVLQALDTVAADRIILLYGSKCHPEFDEFLQNYPVIRFEPANCIELILGEHSQDSRTFCLTSGWMLKWREIFDTGWGVDEVAMRQSFACYDRILFTDTGVSEITDEQLLDFFEHTRIPIEVEQGGLAAFKAAITTAIRQAILTGKQGQV
ncbi:hypothetical protein SPSPH_031160 [Sporomusa sphaeroides DSM 2875]|uniref:DUF1638 domain-containing protein n=2 Tax=Sporomusa TaxID=2375 RepID=A0ABM9W2N7_9FIRM|nr:DUF1638 domain-containing protein [Sporomusa sphaeroides]OLS54996.1 hypothetical protein SPSPH_37330 [Sporomusa sphaeroides DSM 2875]CVK19442.1 hypothetical protein SSPH_02093 [Sporomusa sphaeroides DSM 2875]SCM78343.1 conserved hypothetical protein [uncultured Sporomusa sp.]